MEIHRMEGGDVGYWRIDEQCGLQEEDEKGIVSKTRRWVVKRGVRLGKKVVITGIVVSSAPLVLPPLITICVVGFVVLVPAGVFLASYACTEKLMSKLLPIPAPPLLLEYHSSQEAFRDGNQVEEELYGKDYEEMKMKGEERIELVIRDNEEEEDGSEYVEKHDDKKGIGIDDDENLEEEVYVAKEDINVVEYNNNIDENMEKGYEEEDGGEYLEVEHMVKEIIVDDDDEDLKEEEATGDEYLEEEHDEVEKLLDNNIYNENLEKLGYEEDYGEYLEGEHDDDEDKNEIKIDKNLEKVYEEAAIGESFEGEHEEEEEEEDDEKDDIYENLEKGYEEEEDDDSGEYLVGEHEEDKKEISIIDEEDLEEGYEEDVGEYLEEEEGEHEGPMLEMNIETDEPGREELLQHSEFGENIKSTQELDLVATSARDTENYNINEAEENFEHTSLTLLGNVGSSTKEDEEHLEKPSGLEEEEEDKKDTRRSSKVDENPFIGTEAAKVEITTVVAVVKETELAPEETDEKQGNVAAAEQVSPGLPPPDPNEINSNKGAGAPSSEVMVSEEKIWEQLSAIKGILGYTAAPQSSTVDELKALFILTGVEPPSPFEDPSDLADVDEKLRLLMSIVGAK